MRKIVAFIPNLFTLGNLFCGCLAIVFAFEWRLDLAAYMVFLAAFLDFFDGFLARILKVSGELGKQLDSLADMVSFGVVPGIIMFQWLTYIGKCEMLLETNDVSFMAFYRTEVTYAYLALIIPIFSCYRLAKFNIDTRQSHGFIGLPTPANAIFFCSIVIIVSFALPVNKTFQPAPYLFNANSAFYLSDIWSGGEILEAQNSNPNPVAYKQFYYQNQFILERFCNKFIVIGFIILFSILLVSPLPLFALKFKNFGWNENKIRYIFLGISLALLILFKVLAIPFIVILYILISIVNNIFKITV